MYFVISPIKLGRFWRNLKGSFLNKFAAKWSKHFPPHLNNVSTLVKLEMLITHVLPLSCQRKKLQNLSHLNCGLEIRHIWIQLITACENIAREGAQNMHHWSRAVDDANDEWLPQWQRDPAWPTPFSARLSRCFSSSRSVMRVLYTFSCNSPHML